MSKDSSLTNLELKPSDANIMIRFVGEFNSNLKFIEKMYDVKIFQNGNNLKISGSEDNINLSKDLINELKKIKINDISPLEGLNILNEMIKKYGK